ncbi:hypothetical protein [Janthinobacterium sp. PSPC3-1]|uniref:hypothetical protein n=1 Tax=Janthinobacterium sp. PSPC3-1 TaxID=2804653 RepID=UPI003CFA2186
MEVEDEIVFYRNVLEIVWRHHPLPRISATALPDAIVIKMNPGSSRPLKGEPEQLQRHQMPLSALRLLATRPDNTQYQIMRIMFFLPLECGSDTQFLDRAASSKAIMARFDPLEK